MQRRRGDELDFWGEAEVRMPLKAELWRLGEREK